LLLHVQSSTAWSPLPLRGKSFNRLSLSAGEAIDKMLSALEISVLLKVV
jgi:hypothetical protein